MFCCTCKKFLSTCLRIIKSICVTKGDGKMHKAGPDVRNKEGSLQSEEKKEEGSVLLETCLLK